MKEIRAFAKRFMAVFCAFTLAAAAAPIQARAADVYTLSYDYNAGPAIGSVPGTEKYAGGESVAVAKLNDRTGYKFAGWNTAADGSESTTYSYGDNIVMDKDITLYAQWSANNYSVAFLNDGANASRASISGDGTQTVPYLGKAKNTCTVTTTSSDYVLTGWSYDYTAADGSRQNGFAQGNTGYDSVSVRGDVTFHAVIYKTTFISAAANYGKVSIAGTAAGAAEPSSTTAAIANVDSGTLPVMAGVRFSPDSGDQYLYQVVVRSFGANAASMVLQDGTNTFNTTDQQGNTTSVTVTLDMMNGTVQTDRTISSPIEIDVYYKSALSSYTIQYYQQKGDLSGYDEVTGDTKVIAADSGSEEPIAVRDYSGFTFQSGNTVYIDSACSGGQSDARRVKFDGTSVVQVYYSRNSYTLSFDANGHGAAPDARTVFFDTKTAEPSQPTSPGFTFGGWYRDAGCTGTAVDFSAWAMPAGNTTLYARWTENPNVAIRYRSADETMGTVKSAGESVAPATGTAAGSEAQAKAGYTFVNWTDASGSIVSTSAEFVPAKVSGFNIAGSYAANFVPGVYTVTFDKAGGTLTENEQSVTYGKAYGELPVPVRPGYTFDGWFTQAAGGTQIKEDARYNTAGNSTLYAHWTENPDITIQYRSADETMGTVKSAGESVAPATGTAAGSEAQAKAGYTFVNWTDASGSIVSTSAEFVPAKVSGFNIAGSYAANFVPGVYTVTFDKAGGTLTENEQSVTYGKAYGELPVPVRPGYTFDGWFTQAAGGTQIKEDTLYKTAGVSTIYAHWTVHAVTEAAGISSCLKSPKTGDASSTLTWLAVTAGVLIASDFAVFGRLRRAREK